MKRRVSWFQVALVILVLALAASVFATTALADAPYRWPPYSSPYGANYGCIHRVLFGETLSSIAGRYGTSVFGLMQMNGLRNSNLIYAGMMLRVPCVGTNYLPPCYSATYIVQPGDDLFRIGLRYGLSYYTLMYYNGLRNPNLIFAGMRLLIPCSARYSPGSSPTPVYVTPPAPSTPPAGGQMTVVMRNLAFNPFSTTIRVGQTVVWRNDDSAPHTTTSGSCAGQVCTPMPGWDSGTLNTGQSFSHTFNTAGTFTYYCRIHGAMMQGTIVVTS
jgi:plastocyanin